MSNNYTQGFIALTVRGENLNFEEISSFLNLKPTSCKKRKDNEWVHCDSWCFEIKYDTPDKLNVVIEEFCKKVSKINFDALKTVYNNFSIRLSVQSEMAQIGFTLENKVMSKLMSLGADLEMSIFSWGGAEDE